MKYEHFIKITPQNAVSTQTTDNPHLYWYYAQIGCDSIEVVRPPKSKSMIMVCDEEGAINGSPLNLIASFIAGQLIYGTVLIAQEGTRNGEPDVCGYSIEAVTAARIAIHISLMKSGLFEDAREDNN